MKATILGILNITTDSFSDGGRYLQLDAAIAQGLKLASAGAQIVDIGAAASNPDAAAVSPGEEIERLAPVIAALSGAGISVSVDSFAPEVQRWAMEQDVAYLNDIHGFPHRTLYPALAESRARLIVMHAVQESGVAIKQDVAPEEVFPRIVEFFAARIAALTNAGIDRSRLILDPGMGMFLGSRAQSSFEVLSRIPELKAAFGLPVLISVSRKSFLRYTTGRDISEVGPATLAAELFAVFRGADYIRTHDPAALRDGLTVWSAALSRNTTSNLPV